MCVSLLIGSLQVYYLYVIYNWHIYLCQELPQDIGEALCELLDGGDDVDLNLKRFLYRFLSYLSYVSSGIP